MASILAFLKDNNVRDRVLWRLRLNAVLTDAGGERGVKLLCKGTDLRRHLKQPFLDQSLRWRCKATSVTRNKAAMSLFRLIII